MPLGDVSLHVVDDWDSAVDFMNWLSRGRRDRLAVDTETTGLEQHGRDRIRMIQVGWTDAGWSIPWHSYRGLWEEVVRRFTGRYVMANAKFDFLMLAKEPESCHVPTHRIDDVRIMSHILEPNRPTALKSQAGRHVDPLAAAAQSQLDAAMAAAGWDWATVPMDFPPYWQYGALDTVLTAHLDEHHRPLVQAQAPEAYDLELAAQFVIMNMESYGVHVDREFASQTWNDFLKRCREIEKLCVEDYDVTPGSDVAVIERLQRDGVEFWKRTPGGRFALDKEVLEHCQHPLAELVLERRRKLKLSSTYLRHFADDADSNDLLHPSINTLGARTSRMSMSEPNLQNLPRRSEDNPAANTVRDCITTRYDGGTLLMCDFDQIEMRMLAHMSQDPGLHAAFASPNDFFVELARAVYRDPALQKRDPRRSVIKNVGYAQIYGAGLEKLALTAGVPVDQVRVVKQRFDALYPRVRVFQKEVERRAWVRQRDEGEPYALSPLTGRRHYADRNKIYALVNYLIQGTAAEFFKRKILALDALGLGPYMVVPVHDEIVLDVPSDVVNDAVDALRTGMNDTTTFSVPVSASVSRGVRWGSKEEITC
jgi:DNA polymerase I